MTSTAATEPANYAPIGTYPQGPEHYARMITPYRQFELTARNFPGRLAVQLEDGTQFTFAELDEMICAFAAGLHNLGVKSGEVVCASAGNHWMQLPLFLALARMRALFMATSRYLTKDEIAYQIDQARPRLIIGDGGISFEDVLKAAGGTSLPIEGDEWAPLHVRFSSGTTGKPKMMIALQRASAMLSQHLILQTGMREDDRQLVVGPLAHAALHFAIPQLIAGGTCFMREAFDKENFWADCEKHAITNTMVVPTMIASALEYAGVAPELRTVTSLGASLAPPLKHRLLERFPNLGLYEMYGASEHGMVSCLRPEDQLRKPASVGRAVFGQEVLITDDDGAPIPQGEIGNIYIRGPMVVSAYVGDVQPTPPPPHLAKQGWLPCGDLGYMDEEGFLFISDRRSDLIISGGLNVYPAEVENTLLKVEGVSAVAVIGLSDERWGHVVTAYFVGTAAEEDMVALCRKELAAYKLPRAFHCVSALPQTSSGKISRTLIRDAVAKGALPGG